MSDSLTAASVPAPAAALPALLRSDVEDFLYLEARLLDERRFEDWEALYTDDAEYWVPARPGQADPYTEVSIFFDDRELMGNRIARLRHPDIHVQSPPSRTVRLVSNVRIEKQTQDTVEVSSALLVADYRKGHQRFFAARTTHQLARAGDQLHIRRKKIELINADASFAPLAIPF